MKGELSSQGGEAGGVITRDFTWSAQWNIGETQVKRITSRGAQWAEKITPKKKGGNESLLKREYFQLFFSSFFLRIKIKCGIGLRL